MVQTKCEIYSRVVGYIRPVEQWHNGKQAEFSDRKKFEATPTGTLKGAKAEEQAQLC